MINNIEFCKRGIIIDNKYIISDTHIGYSNIINTMKLDDERDNIIERIKNVTEKPNINELVINGDVFHEFKTPSDDARHLFSEIKSMVELNNCKLTCIYGNHDEKSHNSIKSIYDFEDFYSFSIDGNKIVVTHGHNVVDNKNAELYIFGHIHPVININGVKWPTYLYSDQIDKDYNILISPCFSTYQDGVIVSDDTVLSVDFPYLRSDEFDNFKPYVYDSDKDEVREFPPLSEISNYI